MTRPKRGLGRGLDALLGDRGKNGALSSTLSGQGERLLNLPIDKIRKGSAQPRHSLDDKALKELSVSIRAQGLIQPVVVRAAGEHYELIAGERRWRAAQMAGLHTLPALLRDVDDHKAACMALVENIQRHDLNPVEEALALRRLTQEFDMTHDALSQSVGRSRAAVSNLLRLLSLAPDVLEALRQGTLSVGHAKVLLGLPKAFQERVARKVCSQELSVRATERLVRDVQALGEKALGVGRPVRKKRADADTLKMERELSERLAARVRLHHNTKGSGTLQIHYNSLAELEGILEHIR